MIYLLPPQLPQPPQLQKTATTPTASSAVALPSLPTAKRNDQTTSATGKQNTSTINDQQIEENKSSWFYALPSISVFRKVTW
ncbi:hypothetical protein DOY81_010125 [Sarcophaga bullata]|nr:hypothetical protein DOY81_010125 [Sarcophaga bullata]